MDTGRKFDVAILGAGIGGALLAAVLARHGVKVLLIEQGSHPRFAIGESTIPETTFLLRLLARRYNVPEIAHLCNFQKIRTHVSSACGVKRNFSFIYHRTGETQRPQETTQFPTWAPPFGPDVHFFRQDIDAYMYAVAISYGAVARQQTQVKEIVFEPDGVRINAGAEEFRAQYVVDAGGMKAPIADMKKLRETPPPLKTRSRSIYTHMIGVIPYDACGAPQREHGMPSPFSQGTLHHLFKGGWMWVIPFDNHPTSTNPLVSVGLTLDLEHYPENTLPAEDEFRQIIRQFPTVAAQFERARAVRPWTKTGRLQYWSTQVVGERYCLIPHAAAFVDPLFSSGLAITMATINVLADTILQAVREDDFSTQKFEYIDTWVKHCFRYYDDLVSGSYAAFSDFELWNAWHRVWMLGSLYGVSGLFEVLGRYESKNDPKQLELLKAPPYRGVQGIDFEPYARLFKSAVVEIERFRSGASSAEATVTALYSLLRESGICPAPWALLDREDRCPAKTFTFLPMIRVVAWGRYRSPAEVSQNYYTTGRTGGFIGDIVKDALYEIRRLRDTAGGLLRDAVFSWNRDWRRGNAALTTPAAAFAKAKAAKAEAAHPSKPVERAAH
ncbi:MAG: NAD(P)/FAD-dependent oxidoreductase [Sulfurifustaceae bacterium]